mmetsp:Transcript_24537/g.73646  ORF Transcript_24537/g.73646 Transcript_24537/m.73646 type:complete len:247 (-) Transcript_24537:138-878(-)
MSSCLAPGLVHLATSPALLKCFSSMGRIRSANTRNVGDRMAAAMPPSAMWYAYTTSEKPRALAALRPSGRSRCAVAAASVRATAAPGRGYRDPSATRGLLPRKARTLAVCDASNVSRNSFTFSAAQRAPHPSLHTAALPLPAPPLHRSASGTFSCTVHSAVLRGPWQMFLPQTAHWVMFSALNCLPQRSQVSFRAALDAISAALAPATMAWAPAVAAAFLRLLNMIGRGREASRRQPEVIRSSGVV